jgi:hypothetical protein
MKEQRPEVRNELLKSRKMTDDISKKLTAGINDFQGQFKPA